VFVKTSTILWVAGAGVAVWWLLSRQNQQKPKVGSGYAYGFASERAAQQARDRARLAAEAQSGAVAIRAAAGEREARARFQARLQGR